MTTLATPPSTRLREEPHNLLPLEEWRALLGYHPAFFYQLTNSKIPITSACNGLVYEYAWQNADAVGRSEIRQAILDAEQKLIPYLNYSPAPHYVVETIPWPRYSDTRFQWYGYAAADGRWMTVRAKEGYTRAAGVETLTLIDTPDVVYSDSDGDGLDDTFTLTVSTTVTDTEEIAVYFQAADRLDGQPAGERWRIQPLRVSITAGVATIKGRSWMLVRPILYEGIASGELDPDVTANFAEHLEVYRRYTSAGTSFDTAQAVLIWETRPWPYWANVAAPTMETDPAGEAYALCRAGIRDATRGTLDVGQSVYDAVTGEWNVVQDYGTLWRPPDRVIVRYLAGWPLENGRVAAAWRDVIARFAAAELTRPINACEASNRNLYHWMYDLSQTGGNNDERYEASDDVTSNPFGSRRGQVYAWRAVEKLFQPHACTP